MTFKQAIYDSVLRPMYVRVYGHIEEMENVSRQSLKLEHKKDIINTLSDIIVIKEKYGINYADDLTLLSKYKI
jgi:hypothetical protein